MIVRTFTVLAVCLMLAGAGTAQAAPTAAQKCQASKNAAAGKYAACRERAEAKLASTGNTAAFDAAIAKCETRYQTAWNKAEQKAVDAGSSCTTTNDQTVVQGVTDDFTDSVAQYLGGAAFPDCPGNLATCNSDLTTCNGNLSTCNAGTAAAADVLSGKTFSSGAGLGIAGTMPNNGAVTLTPTTTDQAIAAGYHNGSGKCAGDPDLVSGNIKSGVNLFGINGDPNVVNTNSGDAVAGDLLSGKIAWVSGAQVTGAMPNNGAVTVTPGTVDQAIAAGYHNGSGKVVGDADLVSGNIRSGVNLFGVTGSPSVVETNTGTAAADDLLGGKTAYVNGSLVTGTVPAGSNVNGPNGSSTFTIPDGLYAGSKTATANDANLVAGNIKSGTSIFGVAGSSNVVDTAGATASAADMASGETAYVNGSLVTGTVAAGTNVNGPNGLQTFTIPDGLYRSSRTATANDTNLVGGNIVTGVSILGVAGTQPPSQPLKTGQTTAYGTGSDGDLQKGDARSFTDNGNGTITDNKTGLMWEKKDQATGGIHNYANTYTWSGSSYGSGNVMDGTVTSTFLAALNTPPCFAGYCDWRIPNRFELESIQNLGNPTPTVDAAFNTSCATSCTVDGAGGTTKCSCTYAAYYWTSSTQLYNPAIVSSAWAVRFDNGYVTAYTKNLSFYVRAVRGGS